MGDVNEARERSIAYLRSLLKETDKRKERLIERGWERVLEHGHFNGATEAELARLRLAYFAGAKHSYLVIIGNLNIFPAEPGETGYELFSAVEDEILAEPGASALHHHKH